MSRRAWTAQLQGTAPTARRATQKTARSPALAGGRPSLPQRAEQMRQALGALSDFDSAIPLCQVVDCDPVPKPRMTQADRHRKRPPVLRYRAYCDALRLARVCLPHRFIFVAYLAMPSGWPEAMKREFDGQPCLVKPDASNLAKAIEDATTQRDERLFDGRTIKRWAWRGRVLVVNPAHAHDLDALVRAHQPSR